jgi:hypothetical protein
MNPEERKHWEEMLDHRNAVTKACNFWADVAQVPRNSKTWQLLNEASHAMLQELNDYAKRCKCDEVGA